MAKKRRSKRNPPGALSDRKFRVIEKWGERQLDKFFDRVGNKVSRADGLPTDLTQLMEHFGNYINPNP